MYDHIEKLHNDLERHARRKERLHQIIPIKGNDLRTWRGFC